MWEWKDMDESFFVEVKFVQKRVLFASLVPGPIVPNTQNHIVLRLQLFPPVEPIKFWISILFWFTLREYLIPNFLL